MRFEINVSGPRGIRTISAVGTVKIVRPPENSISSARGMTWKWKFVEAEAAPPPRVPIQLIGEERQFVQLCIGE